MPDLPDHYKVLQVDPEAEDEVIQAAYRRLAQKYHPDVAPGDEAAARMIAINAAWSVLREMTTRAAYDAERRAAAGHAAAQASRRADEAARRTASRPPRYAAAQQAPPRRTPDETSPDWTAGRSYSGSAYEPGSMRQPDGAGAAGAPPGNPSGSVLTFGRYARWSLGEIARRDLEYIEWLERLPIGGPYREEIDAILRAAARRRTAVGETQRRGLFRRR
ncbi:MAG: J domain-containing protein [Candidatus Limnocylindrales bacterium]